MSQNNYTPQQLQTCRALQTAAARIGANGYLAERSRRKMTAYQAIEWQRRNGRSIYLPTAEHCAVVEAMGQVLAGEMSPDDAMNLLHQYDVMQQRLGEVEARRAAG